MENDEKDDGMCEKCSSGCMLIVNLARVAIPLFPRSDWLRVML